MAHIPEPLRQAYASGELVAFVGEGLSAAAGLPTRRELLERLLAGARDYGLYPARVGEIEELVDEGELLEALSDIELVLTAPAFTRMVQRALDDAGRDPPALTCALVELGELRGVITTNLDRLLERAFEARWPCYTRLTADFLQTRGWIFKLHGTLAERDTWILTQSEYQRAVYRDPMHRRLLESIFLAPPLLFIGFGFDDPDFAAVLARITELAEGQPPNHFALLPESALAKTARRRLAEAGIEVIDYANADGDHGECVELLRSLAREA